MDLVRRRGFNALTIRKWEAWLALERDFSRKVGGSIYAHLPDVVNTTFGLTLHA